MSEKQEEDCLSEVRVVFEKLQSWKEQSQTQFNSIIDSHNASITKGISGLMAEMVDMRAELSITKKEKNILVDTVDRLNNEIKQMKANLREKPPSTQHNEKLIQNDGTEESSGQNNKVKGSSEANVSDSACNDTLDLQDRSTGQEDLEIEQSELQDFAEEKKNHALKGNDSSEVDISVQVDVPDSTNNDMADIHDLRIGQKDQRMRQKESHSSPLRSSQGYGQSDLKQEGNCAEISSRDGRKLAASLEKGSKELICEECKFTTTNVDYFRIHLEHVHGVVAKKYACELCPYDTSDKQKFKIHNFSIHNIGDSRFQCKLCPYKTIYKHAFISHSFSIHKIGEAKYKCEFCSFVSSSNGTFKVHVEQVHGGVGDHICELCGLVTPTKVVLRRHLKRVHQSVLESQNYACELCPFKTHNKLSLTIHVKAMHLPKTETYDCNKCDFFASSKIHLYMHKRTKHGGEKGKYVCDKCAFTSSYASSMERHMEIKHVTEPQSHACDECDFTTSHTQSLKRHKHLKHGPRDKNIKCGNCTFATHSEVTLKRHVNKAHLRRS